MSRKKNELKTITLDTLNFIDYFIDNYDNHDKDIKKLIIESNVALEHNLKIAKQELSNEILYLCEKHAKKLVDMINAFQSISFAKGALTIAELEWDKHEELISLSNQPEQKSDV